MGFAKLDSGILDSTLWMQPHDVLRVWIAILAKADSRGFVRASVPSMAHLCMVPIERMEQILVLLTSPDKYSRSSNDEGRRLEVSEGGWRIINYAAYRRARDDDERREYQREWDRQNRPSGAARKSDSAQDNPTAVRQSDTSPTPVRQVRQKTTKAEAEEAEVKKQEHSPLPSVEGRVISPSGETTPSTADDADQPPAKKRPDCPVKRIATLFAEKLPELPQPDVWEGELGRKRHAAVSARWREMAARYDWTEQAQGLEFFGRLFTFVSRSQFLMGKARPREKDGKPFQLRFDWLFRPTNFGEVIEGKYHDQGEKRRT